MRPVSIAIVTTLSACAPAPAPETPSPSSAAPAPVVTWFCRDDGGVSRVDAPLITPAGQDGAIAAALQDAYPAARACVAHAASPRGRLTFSLTPSADGSPKRTCVVPSSELDPALAACLADALATVRLPAGTRTVVSRLEPAGLPPPRVLAPLSEACVGDEHAPRPRLEPAKAPGVQPANAGTKVTSADRVIAAAKGKIRACYQAELDRHQDLAGRLPFTITIDASGAAVRACTSGEGLNETARGCIAGTLLTLRFDPPEGGAASVTGNFSFVNQNGSQKWPWGISIR